MPTSSIVSNTAEAWRRYASIGAIASSLLRPHVLRAWLRSHDQGASPWVARAETLSRNETERLLSHQARLVSVTRPYLNLLSQAAGNERHAAMLGTAEAIVLDVVGDEQSVSGPERVPGPGALLSEATCGSNGIGTPLVEGRYVELVSTEHFIHGFHPFTCHGIPIETPDGARAGVLSVSVRQPETAERLHEILVCAAYGIATELLRHRVADLVQDVMAAGDSAPFEALRAELVHLGAVPLRRARIAAGPAEGSFHETIGLLRAAAEASRELERRERAWRELSSDDLGMPAHVELADEITDLLDLLEPEIARRHIEVTRGGEWEAGPGIADRRKLRRDLFRLLLRALDAADGGGAIFIRIGQDPTRQSCHARIEAVPGPERPGERMVSSIMCPRMPRPDW